MELNTFDDFAEQVVEGEYVSSSLDDVGVSEASEAPEAPEGQWRTGHACRWDTRRHTGSIQDIETGLTYNVTSATLNTFYKDPIISFHKPSLMTGEGVWYYLAANTDEVLAVQGIHDGKLVFDRVAYRIIAKRDDASNNTVNDWVFGVAQAIPADTLSTTPSPVVSSDDASDHVEDAGVDGSTVEDEEDTMATPEDEEDAMATPLEFWRRGRAKSWHARKGYGFIVDVETGDEFMAHHSALQPYYKQSIRPQHNPVLFCGESVWFRVGFNPDPRWSSTMCAIQVRGDYEMKLVCDRFVFKILKYRKEE